MLGVDRGTPEEFYSRRLANAQVLEAAARRRAAAGDRVGAFADAWGADMNTLQATMWERILVAARSPQRQFFQVAEAVVGGLRAPRIDGGDAPTVGRALAAARNAVAGAFDEGLAIEMAARWPDIAYLEAVPAVTPADIDASVEERLDGLTPTSFIERRRRESAKAMLDAQAKRVRGDTVAAIHGAYEADFAGLDAYLVESAMAVGDIALLTVTIRWDLASQAVADLPGLPDDFAGAVGAIRGAVASRVGDSDGGRLLSTLEQI